MDRLNVQMQQLIGQYSAGSVATVNADGSPSVSPKATFVVVDECCIAYGNIRSPGTSANLRERPAVEVNFIDVLARVALRVRGQARLVARDHADASILLPPFEALWAPYLDMMSEFVCIDIEQATVIRSPAYDVGLKRRELMQTNLAKLCGFLDEENDA